MRFQIDWASLLDDRKFTVFALFYFVFEGNCLVQAPGGAYIWRGDLTEGYEFGGLIHGGLIFGILRYTSKGYGKLIYLHRPQDGCGVGKVFRRFGNIQEFIEKRYVILARIGFVIIYTALQI